MRMICVTLAAAALVQPALSFGATVAGSEECAALSQNDMRTCLEQNAAASELELVLAERAASSAMARWDEDPKYIRSASAALKTSSKSFMQFRHAQCGFVASLGGGAIGNAAILRRLACMTELNRQQAASIQQAVANLPVK